MIMRSGASVSQERALRVAPRGARITRFAPVRVESGRWASVMVCILANQGPQAP